MRPRIVTLCAAALVMALTGSLPAHASQKDKQTPNPTTGFETIKLVTDNGDQGSLADPKLVNAWGMAMGKTLWVSGTGSGTATVYTGGGTAGALKKEATEVSIPGGAPTGQVFNPGSGFKLKAADGTQHPASFIFASPSGAITAWHSQVNQTQAIIVAFVRHADIKGLALMRTNRGDFLLAPDFFHRKVHVYNKNFNRVRMPRNAFIDPLIPDDYAPFNVEIVGRTVIVTYAQRDPQTGKAVGTVGRGIVSQFNAEGKLLRRIAAGGRLSAPWGITTAPRSWGALRGALIIGNHGDGRVNVYHPRTYRFLGQLARPDGNALEIPGLWGLIPGTAANGGEHALWYAAGPDGGQHGRIGLLVPAGSAGGGTPQPTPTPTPSVSATPTATPTNSYGSY
jgi:uncharacterized protein (TIGR03118 family)